MAYRALLLDLDDTLFDRTAALRAWASQLSEDEFRVLQEIDGRGHRSRELFAADAKARLGLSIDPVRFGHELLPHIVPEPGVAETLAKLGQTHRIAIVTNGGTAQRAKLAALKIEAHAVFVSGELGITKPALGIFERALKWTEHAPADVLFVGDDPVIDLAPAASLGMPTAWRVRGAWPRELAPPTHRITSIAELASL